MQQHIQNIQTYWDKFWILTQSNNAMDKIYVIVVCLFILSGIVTLGFGILWSIQRYKQKKKPHFLSQGTHKSLEHIVQPHRENKYESVQEHVDTEQSLSIQKNMTTNLQQPDQNSKISSRTKQFQNAFKQFNEPTDNSMSPQFWNQISSFLESHGIHKVILFKVSENIDTTHSTDFMYMFQIFHYKNFMLNILLDLENQLSNTKNELYTLCQNIVYRNKRILISGNLFFSKPFRFLFEESEINTYEQLYLIPFEKNKQTYLIIFPSTTLVKEQCDTKNVIQTFLHMLAEE